MSFKYIMFAYDMGGCSKYIPIVFPDFISHIDVEQAMENILSDKDKYNMPVGIHSAGDVDIGLVECSGDSETLHVKSDEEFDSEIISSYSYLHGIS